jgi:hypothetical protein
MIKSNILSNLSNKKERIFEKVESRGSIQVYVRQHVNHLHSDRRLIVHSLLSYVCFLFFLFFVLMLSSVTFVCMF